MSIITPSPVAALFVIQVPGLGIPDFRVQLTSISLISPIKATYLMNFCISGLNLFTRAGIKIF